MITANKSSKVRLSEASCRAPGFTGMQHPCTGGMEHCLRMELDLFHGDLPEAKVENHRSKVQLLHKESFGDAVCARCV